MHTKIGVAAHPCGIGRERVQRWGCRVCAAGWAAHKTKQAMTKHLALLASLGKLGLSEHMVLEVEADLRRQGAAHGLSKHASGRLQGAYRAPTTRGFNGRANESSYVEQLL